MSMLNYVCSISFMHDHIKLNCCKFPSCLNKSFIIIIIVGMLSGSSNCWNHYIPCGVPVLIYLIVEDL